jgi:hypothetical protein
VIIAYGRGFRPNFDGTQTSIVKSTGLLSATSDPTGSQVVVDGKLVTATNNSVTIDPGEHNIQISKDGYLTWEKHTRIDKEVVSRADAFLFPMNPSLSPLTNSGITSELLSPDGTKIVYVIPPKTKPPLQEKNIGLWVYDLVDRPLGFNRDPRQVSSWDSSFDFQSGVYRWSPDSTELLIDTPRQARLYTISKLNDFQIVTNTVDDVLKLWADGAKTKELQQLSSFKPDIINFATSSAVIISFSPDETKFAYEATASATLPPVIIPPLIGANSTPETRHVVPGKIYVYDGKEDKNYFLFDKTEVVIPSPTPTRGTTRQPTPTPTPLLNSQLSSLTSQQYPFRWFPTNRHLILTLPGKIDILEYDRTNWITVYAGPFLNNFVAPWPGGSRIIIVTNLNPGGSPLPNLYTVNLR